MFVLPLIRRRITPSQNFGRSPRPKILDFGIVVGYASIIYLSITHQIHKVISCSVVMIIMKASSSVRDCQAYIHDTWSILSIHDRHESHAWPLDLRSMHKSVFSFIFSVIILVCSLSLQQLWWSACRRTPLEAPEKRKSKRANHRWEKTNVQIIDEKKQTCKS